MDNLITLIFPILAVMALLLILCFILCMVALSKAGRHRDKAELDAAEKISELEEKLKKLPSAPAGVAGGGINRIGVVRFDAFAGLTGHYSFSVAFLNDDSDGVIITSLYGRESCSTYLREIKSGECETPLLAEERSALDKAMQN